MPCYHPMLGYRARIPGASGKRAIVFNVNEGFADMTVNVPCGQCVGCRLERSRQWAIRCMHEASMHEQNCFITLTFDNENLDPEGSLRKEDFQKFMKRLRKRTGAAVRYYHCGEYGSKLSRPHHHACLFGYDFPDRYLFIQREGVALYRSPLLESLWPFGISSVGEVTFESAAYVARYIMKKQLGKGAEEFYRGKIPEYTTMSRRPGIGSSWYEKFKDDVYPSDEVFVRRGVRCKPPKYYDALFDLENPEEFAEIKRSRIKAARSRDADQSEDRLAAREKVTLARVGKLKRSIEE